jgi:hypothetical protein
MRSCSNAEIARLRAAAGRLEVRSQEGVETTFSVLAPARVDASRSLVVLAP